MKRKAEGHTSHLNGSDQAPQVLGKWQDSKLLTDITSKDKVTGKTEHSLIDNIFREIPREWQNRITDWAFLNNLFLIAIVLYKTVLKMKHSKTQQQCKHS